MSDEAFLFTPLAATKNSGFNTIETRFGDEVNLDSVAGEVKRVGDAAAMARLTIESMWVWSKFLVSALEMHTFI